MIRILVLLFFPCHLVAQAFSATEINRWQQQARQVTIIRDHWGIPHVYGKTDADCVFGLMYAQCEDDFKRIERNYIEILGRSAEILSKVSIYDDLFIKLLVDSADAISDFKKSPPWLQKLLNAFADGMNFYLHKNPGVKPLLLTRFEPWYPLMWTDGSISAIQSGGINETELEEFYNPGNSSARMIKLESEQNTYSGSNGFAIAPSKSISGNALLYINPHVTFYFRPEVHMVSNEGLNAYGAVTWGQFFVYQGFNEHCGWMHTSGYSDVADLYEEEIVKKVDSYYYRYNEKLLPLKTKEYSLQFLKDEKIQSKKIKAYFTHHGPIMAKRNGKWIAVKANNRSLNALIQSWNRTKSKNFEEFKKNLMLVSNCSNNTVYADDKGNIAYWHGNFVPRRDTTLDWNEPVNGTISSTEWKELHSIDEIIHLYNPVSGWIQNCNSSPFSASGKSSPNKNEYPFYMATEPENFRSLNAARVLSKENSFTIDKLIAAGYNSYLAAFEQLVPALVNAYEKEKTNDSFYTSLQLPVSILKQWNLYASDSSVATTLAIYWGQKLQPAIAEVKLTDRYSGNVEKFRQYAGSVPARALLDSFQSAINELKKRFGNWQIPWGKLNRYQRLTGELRETYDDSKPSLPVGMVSSFWGCLPSFVSRHAPGTVNRYGYSGNSFICAVEFGKKIKAKSLLAGGVNSNPHSLHFGDQAEMYSKGQFKDVLFYKKDVLKNTERRYHPGE